MTKLWGDVTPRDHVLVQATSFLQNQLKAFYPDNNSYSNFFYYKFIVNIRKKFG